MFCPNCREEFRDEITVCPDCEIELVQTLPPKVEPFHDQRPFVTVYECTDPAVLPVLESILEAAEIPFVVRGRGAAQLFPASGCGLAARIQVPAELEDEAWSMLAAAQEVPDLGEEEGPQQTKHKR